MTYIIQNQLKLSYFCSNRFFGLKKNSLKNIFPISIILFFLISIFQVGCIDDTAEQEAIFKNAVDTLYYRGIKQFNIDLDSICTLQKDSMILSYMDSITEIRLKEIENLKQK